MNINIFVVFDEIYFFLFFLMCVGKNLYYNKIGYVLGDIMWLVLFKLDFEIKLRLILNIIELRYMK